MNYVWAVNIIFSTLYSLLGVLVFHFILFAIVGIFTKKRFKKAPLQLKYGIIIPARNEEKVVGALIESIRKSNYPREKLDIFLVAHNCTDKTAEIGRKMGVTVYEYNNHAERTMGYAFKYLFDKIDEDYGIKNYDGFFLFNADNIVAHDYFEKMNDAFVSENRESVVTSFRNSKNFGENALTAMYGLYFMYGCRFEACGRAALGVSTRVQGTGYLISSDIVKNGWKYVTLTEDWEFSADQVLLGNKITYCDDAVFYDEQPTAFNIMWRQRVRWARGHLLVFISRYFDILRFLFTKNKDVTLLQKLSVYDLSVNVLPIGIIGAALALFHFIFLLCSVFVGDYSIRSVLQDYINAYAISIGYSYATVALSSLIILLIEKKRIPRVKPFVLIIAILLWPLFILLAVPCDIAALFGKGKTWQPIPHESKIKIDDID